MASAVGDANNISVKVSDNETLNRVNNIAYRHHQHDDDKYNDNADDRLTRIMISIITTMMTINMTTLMIALTTHSWPIVTLNTPKYSSKGGRASVAPKPR